MASTALSGIEKLIQDSRRLVGLEVNDVPRGTSIADWLSVERMVAAVGDENPLYRDVNYGAASEHSAMLAPPAFVFAIRTPTSGASWSQSDEYGCPLPLLTKAEVEWHDHVRLGDRLDSELRVSGVEAGPTWRDRATALVHSEVDYWKQDDARPFARARGTITMYPIRRGGEEKFVDREIYQYSDDEIRQLESELDSEPERRGGLHRYWRDVAPGEQLPTLVKGPLHLSDLMSWVVAEAKPVKLGPLVHDEVLANPGRRTTNPSTNWPYWDAEQEAEDLQSCRDAGFPSPYGRGQMRVSLATHLVTHWMGDDAFLRRISVELPNPFIYGDVMRLTGSVADTFTQDIGGNRYYAATLSLSGVNQLGENVLSGEAVVYLPEPGKPVPTPIG